MAAVLMREAGDRSAVLGGHAGRLRPAIEQAECAVGAYLSRCGAGSDVAILTSHAGVLMCQLTSVTKVKPGIGRLYTAVPAPLGRDSWYIATGQNCFRPRGDSRLIVPTAAVRAFAESFPNG